MPTKPKKRKAIKATKFTPKKRARYLELLGEGVCRCEAAAVIGIDRHTVGAHKERNEKFRVLCEDTEAAGQEMKHGQVEDSLFEAATSGNVTAMIFYLCNRLQDKWRHVRSYQIEHKGAVFHGHGLAALTYDEKRIALMDSAKSLLSEGETDPSGQDVDG